LKSLIKTKDVSYKEIRENDNYELKFKDSRLFLASLVLQRDFILQRDFGYYNETLRFTLFGD
jgi:hypothetical protein